MKEFLRALIILFLFLLIIQGSVYSQIAFSPKIDSIINLCTLQTLSKIDRELSGDTSTLIGGLSYTLFSRYWNSVHNPKAAQLILERFQSFGLSARYMNYTASGTNVIASIIGTKYPNRQYIICSHYDDMPSGTLAPGADDNASGTCGVIEAARLLSPYTFDYTVIFVAFDEEERGLYGSKAYADTSYFKGDTILGVINLDMIAWDGNNDNILDIRTNTNSYNFSNTVKSIFNIYEPVLAPEVIISTTQNSDHASFWNRGYKAFCGIEDNHDFHPHYHTINDNFSHIVMPYFLKFTKAAIASLMTFGWDCFINFAHTPIVSSYDTQPRTAIVVITSPRRIARTTNGPRLYYKVNQGSFSYLNYSYNNLDTFKFVIPGQPVGSLVSYYIAAQDSTGIFMGTLPDGGRGINPPGTIQPPTLFQYSILTGIAENNTPVEFSLSQNYPNPFNPVTHIDFVLVKQSDVKMVVYDMLGRRVSEPVEGKLPNGKHTVEFDGGNLATGIYYYSIYIDGKLLDTKKMILLK